MKKRLEDFFDYPKSFKFLNNTLISEKNINQFHSSNIEFFKRKIDFTLAENSIDWHFRNFRSLREIFHSSLMYTESKVIENQYCIASIFFTKYYSFLHAVKSVLYLTPIDNFNPRIGHSQTINLFVNNYCQGKRKLFNKDAFIKYSKLLRDLREVTSYQIPHSGSDFLTKDEFEEIDRKLTFYLKKLFQLAHYLSFVADREHKSVSIQKNYELFYKYKDIYFTTPHPLKETHIDFSDNIFIHDTLRADGTYCPPFTLFLEHEEDEFLLYGGFDYLNNSNKSFDVADVTSFIWKALF